MAARLRSPLLVGREGELEALLTAVKACRDLDRSIVLVAGDAGIGKTRLLRELRRRLAGSHPPVTVAMSSCVRCTVGELPYSGVLGLLDELEGTAPPRPVREMLRLARAALLGTVAEQPDVRSLGPGLARTRQFELILAPLESLVRDLRRDVVLILDDVQWADPATLDVLAFIAHRLHGARIALAYRLDELGDAGGLPSWLADLGRDLVLDRLVLDPLEPEETADLIRAIVGTTVTRDRVDQIVRRAEGNPLFAEELAALDRHSVSIPATIGGLLRARLDRLGPDARRLVDAAAIVGRDTEPDRLLFIADLTPDELASAIDRAVDGGVLVQDARGQVSFRHGLIAEVVEQRLPPTQRAALHRRVALALGEPGLGDRSAPLLAERAHHWDAAGDVVRAVPALVEAGIAAERVYAWRAAIQALERALELADRSPGGTLDLGDTHRRCARIARQLGELDRALDHATAGLDVAVRSLDPVSVARLVDEEVEALNLSGDVQGGLEVAERAYASSRLDEPVEARLLALLQVGRMRAFAGRSRAAMTALREAYDLATRAGSTENIGYAANFLARVRADLGDAASVSPLHDIARDDAPPGDPDAIQAALLNAAVDHSILGDWAAAFDAIDQARRAARPFGPEFEVANDPYLDGFAASIAVQHGDYRLASDLVSATPTTGPGLAVGLIERLRVWLAAIRGEVRAVVEGADAARPSAARTCDIQAALVEAAVALVFGSVGRSSEAIDAVGEALRLSQPIEAVSDRARVDLAAVMVAGLVADAEGAAPAGPILTRAYDLIAVPAEALRRLGAGVAEPGARVVPVNRARGALGDVEWEHAHGRDDPARWQAAVDLLDAVELRFEGAHARWRLASCLLARREDRARAAGLLREALEYCEAEGVAQLRERIVATAVAARVQLDRLDGQPRVPASPDPWGLSAREREVLELLSVGRTNRQIGEALFVTEKTASSHVTHILAKLGVSSRVEAALVAARAGLGAGHIQG